MTLHLLRIGGITALIVLCIVHPFLPGSYDALALTLSLMAQTLGALGTVFVAPIGAVWLAYEWSKRVTGERPAAAAGRRFAIATVIASSLVVLPLVLVAFASTGVSFGLVTLAAWLYALRRVNRRLRRMTDTPDKAFNPIPFYLVLIPGAVLVFQLALAAPATEYSRHHAIRSAGELLAAIESYHARVGRYPSSLLAVHADYKPDVADVEKFHYAPNGVAYDLYFEQPRFVLDDLGTREFVVYNPRDEQIVISHAAWILLSVPADLVTRQGWYGVREGPSPHWRCFSFD